MKSIRLIVAVVMASLFAAFVSESYGQCGRQVQTQIQAAPQPAVSVFQLPPQSAITSSQSATLATAQPQAFVAPQAFFQPQAFVQPQCASGRCGGGGFLARLRANRPQTIRQTTVIRG